MEEVRFKKNKKSKVTGIVISIVIIFFASAMSILCMQSQYNLSLIIFIVFLVYGFYLLIKLLINADTVTVNTNGILSQVNGRGSIEWKFIEGLEISKAIHSKVLVVKVKDLDNLFKTVNKVSKKLMKTNIKRYGNPVVIPQSEFNEPLENVKERIENYKNRL